MRTGPKGIVQCLKMQRPTGCEAASMIEKPHLIIFFCTLIPHSCGVSYTYILSFLSHVLYCYVCNILWYGMVWYGMEVYSLVFKFIK